MYDSSIGAFQAALRIWPPVAQSATRAMATHRVETSGAMLPPFTATSDILLVNTYRPRMSPAPSPAG